MPRLIRASQAFDHSAFLQQITDENIHVSEKDFFDYLTAAVDFVLYVAMVLCEHRRCQLICMHDIEAAADLLQCDLKKTIQYTIPPEVIKSIVHKLDIIPNAGQRNKAQVFANNTVLSQFSWLVSVLLTSMTTPCENLPDYMQAH